MNNYIIEFEDKNNNSNNSNNNNGTKIKEIIKRKKLKEKNQTIRKKESKYTVIFRNILHLEGIRNAKKKANATMKIKTKETPPKRRYSIKNKYNEELNLDSQFKNNKKNIMIFNLKKVMRI